MEMTSIFVISRVSLFIQFKLEPTKTLYQKNAVLGFSVSIIFSTDIVNTRYSWLEGSLLFLWTFDWMHNYVLQVCLVLKTYAHRILEYKDAILSPCVVFLAIEFNRRSF